MRTLIVLLLASALLAGCASGDGGPVDEEDFSDLGLQATDQTGVLRGVVLDETISPVADAKVTLSTGQTTTSNGDGLFGFSDLDPGTVFLTVAKKGYTETQQSVEVVAGVLQPPVVKVQIARAPGTEPFYVLQSQSAYISCAFQVGSSLFNHGYCDPAGTFFAEDSSSPFFVVSTGRPDYYQSEMTWEHTQEFGKSLTTTQYTCDPAGSCDRSIGSPDRYCQVWGPAPLVCKVSPVTGWGNADGTGGGVGLQEARFGANPEGGYVIEMQADCTACVPGTALGVGLVLEQQVDTYNTLFYNFLPAEEWQFLEDGAPVVPDA